MSNHIILDLDGVIHDPHGTRSLYRDALSALEELHEFDRLSLLTNGRMNEQWFKMCSAGIGLLGRFRSVWVVESKILKLGVIKTLAGSPLSPRDRTRVIVVGDRLYEIAFANELKCTSVRVRREGGKYAGEEPKNKLEEPDETIETLQGLLPIASRIRQSR